jgi:hypothetical protein
MVEYKSKSIMDEKIFTPTQAYKRLYKTFKSLKKTRGRFIHIIGSPGTGKSINIYHALDNLDLKVYEPVLKLDSLNIDARTLFNEMFKVFKEDFQVKTRKEAYKKASDYDMILFADKFLDSEYLEKDKVGVSKWIEHKGLKAVCIYFLIFRELIQHRRDLKHINVVLHHSMVIRYKGVKYDLLVDFGFLSRIIRVILGIFFEYVQISYSKSEIIEIIKSHPDYKDERQIKKYIERYGNKPRLIYQALENK